MKYVNYLFTNEERTRYYGLRIGDLVSIDVDFAGTKETLSCEVIAYGFMDNNRVYIKLPDGTERKWVAEQCTIITKVEDRADYKSI